MNRGVDENSHGRSSGVNLKRVMRVNLHSRYCAAVRAASPLL